MNWILPLLLLAAALPAPGQDAPSVSAPPLPPAANGANGANDAFGETVMVQFPATDVRAVLDFYQTLTGKRVVYDNTVQGPVTININDPVPRADAVTLVEMGLLLHGFTIVPFDELTVKVLSPQKSARSEGVPIISHVSQIPPGEQVVSFLYRLGYADPQEIAQVLSQYVGQTPRTSIVPLPKAQSVLITESTSVIRRLVELVRTVDTPPAEVVPEIIQLERADATKIVEFLNEFLRIEGQTATTPAANRGAPPPNRADPSDPNALLLGAGNQPQGQPAAQEGPRPLSEDSILVGKVRLMADERTNRIHIVSRPVNMPFLRKLIQQLDANVEFSEPTVRPLRYLRAGQVLPILVQMLSEKGGIEATESAGGGGATPGQTTANRTTSSGGSTGSASGTGVSFDTELSTDPVDTTPAAVTIGATRLIADNRSDTIVVIGNQDAKDKVLRMLDELDVPVPQVVINTVIGELTMNEDDEFGFDWLASRLQGGDAQYAGTLRNTGGPSIQRNFFEDIINLVATNAVSASGLTGFITFGNTAASVIRALETTGNFRTISRPTVFTENNKTAVIASGQEIAVPTDTLTSIDAGNPVTSSSVEFKEVTLSLEVVPRVNPDRNVQIQLVQKLDSVAGFTLVGGNQVPNIATRYLKNEFTVPDQSTIFLGGLITQSRDHSMAGVPLIQRIPLLGSLFRNTAMNRTRTELIIMLRPRIIEHVDRLAAERSVEQKGYRLDPNMEEDLIRARRNDPGPKRPAVPASQAADPLPNQ